MRRGVFMIAVGAVCVYSILPFAWQALTSLKPYAELESLPPFFPSRTEMASYAVIFSDGVFVRIIANSFIVASLTTIISVAFGSMAAFALARLDVKRAGLILALVLSVSMLPPVSTVSPLYLMMRWLNLRDTLASLVIAHTTFALPMAIWILRGFIKEIPDEIYAASRVDGCSPFQSFYRVILPLAAPGLSASAILVFIFSWNEFLFALTFTSTPSSRTIPVGIALFPGLHRVPWGEIAAACVVVTVPLIILVFAFQKRIAGGLTIGAVKG